MKWGQLRSALWTYHPGCLVSEAMQGQTWLGLRWERAQNKVIKRRVMIEMRKIIKVCQVTKLYAQNCPYFNPQMLPRQLNEWVIQVKKTGVFSQDAWRVQHLLSCRSTAHFDSMKPRFSSIAFSSYCVAYTMWFFSQSRVRLLAVPVLRMKSRPPSNTVVVLSLGQFSLRRHWPWQDVTTHGGLECCFASASMGITKASPKHVANYPRAQRTGPQQRTVPAECVTSENKTTSKQTKTPNDTPTPSFSQ